jgi:hypothetical protein
MCRPQQTRLRELRSSRLVGSRRRCSLRQIGPGGRARLQPGVAGWWRLFCVVSCLQGFTDVAFNRGRLRQLLLCLEHCDRRSPIQYLPLSLHQGTYVILESSLTPVEAGQRHGRLGRRGVGSSPRSGRSGGAGLATRTQTHTHTLSQPMTHAHSPCLPVTCCRMVLVSVRLIG